MRGVHAQRRVPFRNLMCACSVMYSIEEAEYWSILFVLLADVKFVAKAYGLHILSRQVSNVVFPAPLAPTSK